MPKKRRISKGKCAKLQGDCFKYDLLAKHARKKSRPVAAFSNHYECVTSPAGWPEIARAAVGAFLRNGDV